MPSRWPSRGTVAGLIGWSAGYPTLSVVETSTGSTGRRLAGRRPGARARADHRGHRDRGPLLVEPDAMNLQTIALMMLAAAGVARTRTQRRDLERARQFVTCGGSFCREWCIDQDQAGGNR